MVVVHLVILRLLAIGPIRPASLASLQRGAVLTPRGGAAAATLTPPPPPPLAAFAQNAALRMGCSSAASAATWALIAHRGVGSVMASSAVGLAAGAVLPTPMATAAFCGTFCGMSSKVVAPGALQAAGLGAAAAALLAALDASNTRVLKGYGGRLGVVAALVATASIAMTPSLRASGLLFQPSLATMMPNTLMTNIGASVAGSAAMRLWARRLAVLLFVGSSSSLVQPSTETWAARRAALATRLSNPVASASVVGLLASAALGSARSAVAAAAFTGSFVAMSAPTKVDSTRALLGAAALAGYAQAALGAVSIGAGGKLGAAAALGVLLIRMLRMAASATVALRVRYQEQSEA